MCDNGEEPFERKEAKRTYEPIFSEETKTPGGDLGVPKTCKGTLADSD